MGWFALMAASFVIKLIPYGLLNKFAGALAAFGFAVAVKQRKTALESLSVAFGENKTKEELSRIAKDSFVYMVKSGFDLLSMLDKPELLKKHVFFEGKENLDAALAKGRGVILVSAHFGNFPLALARIAQEGYAVSGIMRPMRDARVEKIFLEKREKYNVKTIYSQPRNTCVEQTIRVLRDNNIVFIPIDQNFGTAGVFVDFFGRKAATATGPVIFAQRTKAALLPCFVVRQNDDSHKIIFETGINLEEKGGSEETIIVNIQKLTGIIESYIRKYPAEWSWIHRRWKSKPNEGTR